MSNLFKISGNAPVSMQFLKMIDKGLATDLLDNLIVLIDISSCPCACKESLAIYTLNNICLPDCLVCKVCLGNKTGYVIVTYRSPSQTYIE